MNGEGEEPMLQTKRNWRLAPAMLASALLFASAPTLAQGTLRIAMTASDVPTTTGMPNNGFEGMRFLGYPAFEGLVDWDLTRADVVADIRPGLAEKWEQDANDPTKWIFHLRRGVKFHDGTDFHADAVIWNIERFFDQNSKQFETQGSAISRGRNPHMKAWRKIDDFTIEITTPRPVSYFPYLVTYLLIASPSQFDKLGGKWEEYAKAPMGTGPFKVENFKSRISVDLARNANYWNKDRVPKLDRITLFPMPEATTRLAALRSGQVDWIEVPPPDAIPSLKQAGFTIVTNSYPHVWPWVLNQAKEDSPFRDVRVRQAANYCMDRAGLVQLLNGTAEPAVGFLKKSDPLFGNPRNAYTLDINKARQLMTEAGYSQAKPAKAKVLISTSGSGQMLPLPMNELILQTIKQCYFDITFEVVEWGTMLVAFRSPPTAKEQFGSDATNNSLVSSDISQMARWFLSSNATPTGSNWGHWKNEEFDTLLTKIEQSRDPKAIKEGLPRLNEILVDQAPWVWIVHDGNPRAMTKKVHNFVSAQSWFQDFTRLELK
jgi:peptide/nickel transport system substrate-binding protein